MAREADEKSWEDEKDGSKSDQIARRVLLSCSLI